MAERIELRHQDVATLEDRARCCLAWLPTPFVPRAAIDAGLARMLRALVPGGWLMVGHGKFGEGGLADALTRLQTVAFGGTAIDGDEAQELLRGVGLDQVATLPTPPRRTWHHDRAQADSVLTRDPRPLRRGTPSTRRARAA